MNETLDLIRDALRSQYRAGLRMLRAAIEACPEDLWFDSESRHTNACWQVAYHTAFFTDFYLQPAAEGYQPWPGHHEGSQYPDGIAGPSREGDDRPLLPPPYAKADVLALIDHIEDNLETTLASLDLTSADSGFPWYPISKLEHQMVNLRHLQHGFAQLADRLRDHCDIGIDWTGAVHSKE